MHCTVRFLLHIQSQAIKDRLCYLVLARKYYSLSLIMWRIRHSDEMRSILELLDKEKSDKLCQIYATKNIPQREICEMFFITPPVGLEPTTLRLTAECSTD